MITEVVQRAQDFLNESQNPDGGWGYHTGSWSVTEPTALVVLSYPSQPAYGRGIPWLLDAQRDDGGWGLNAQDDASNWLTMWATLALSKAATEQALSAVDQGIEWILSVPVLRITDSTTVSDVMGSLGIDPSVSGWPWQSSEASFVEPTTLSLLALGMAGVTAHPRFLEGVTYLRDRECQKGGWNIGNPFMFDKALRPTPHNTALALLAFRTANVKNNDTIVIDGLAVLSELMEEHMAAETLALSIVALDVWQTDVSALRERLMRLQSDNGSWNNSPYATAYALLALQGAEGFFNHG